MSKSRIQSESRPPDPRGGGVAVAGGAWGLAQLTSLAPWHDGAPRVARCARPHVAACRPVDLDLGDLDRVFDILRAESFLAAFDMPGDGVVVTFVGVSICVVR